MPNICQRYSKDILQIQYNYLKQRYAKDMPKICQIYARSNSEAINSRQLPKAVVKLIKNNIKEFVRYISKIYKRYFKNSR